MHLWKKGCLGLALLAGLTPSAFAQIPLTPPSAGGATPLAAPPPAQPTTLCDFLGLSKAQINACKEYMCKTQLGQLMNNSLKPLGALTGGVLGPCCPPFNQEDLNKPADSAEGAAARIKQDEAGAKARRAAVRYLGTVDCHYWPEAALGLISALRTDRNECVRWEAAMAMGSGCCCNKAIIKALAIVVSASDEDGNPYETSERVKAAAARSLSHCLAAHTTVIQPLPIEPAPLEKLEPEPAPVPRPEGPKPEGPPMGGTPPGTSYYKNINKVSMSAILEDARRAQVRSQSEGQQQVSAPAPAGPPQDRTFFGILRASFTETHAEKPATPSAPQPKPTMEPPASLKPVSQAPPPPSPTITPVVYVAPAPPPAATQTLLPPPVVAPAPQALLLPPPVVAPAPLPPVAVVPAAPPPVAVVPAAAPPLSPPQLVTLLETSVAPDQREWAANHLGDLDGTSYPQAVQAVVSAARHDAAPLVRAACVRSLVRMNVNNWTVFSAVQALQSDSDPRVKHEAEQALAHLSPDRPTSNRAQASVAPLGSPH